MCHSKNKKGKEVTKKFYCKTCRKVIKNGMRTDIPYKQGEMKTVSICTVCKNEKERKRKTTKKIVYCRSCKAVIDVTNKKILERGEKIIHQHESITFVFYGKYMIPVVTFFRIDGDNFLNDIIALYIDVATGKSQRI